MQKRVGVLTKALSLGLTAETVRKFSVMENAGYGITCQVSSCLMLTPKGAIPFGL